MQSFTNKQCYSVLEADINCNWKDLKKSYRSLIQKWHPDRFTEESKKELATNKLKEINIAYSTLSKYYRKHGTLPQPEPIPERQVYSRPEQRNPVKPSTVKQSASSNDNTAKTTSNANKSKEQNKRYTISNKLVVVTVLFIAIFTYQILIPDDKPISASKNYQSINSEPQIKQPIKKFKTIKKAPENDHEIFFTYGSTIGKVILTQGPPDEINGNVWYYGKSEIHFAKGKVVRWVRSSNNPLKARAIP